MHRSPSAFLALFITACGDDADDGGASGETDACGTAAMCTDTTASTSTEPPSSSDPTESSGTASSATADSTGASESGDSSSTGQDQSSGTGDAPPVNNPWVLEHCADYPVLTGDFAERTLVETPAFVFEATGTNAKYAFTPREQAEPTLRESCFVDVRITDLVSEDGYGGAIGTSNDDPDHVLYLSNVYVEPNWPAWESYDTTNYDGLVLDATAELYAEDLTIVNWNADSAMDIKSDTAQLVRLHTEGGGNRTLRFWQPGPHYIVESSVNNPTGAVLWFADCPATTLYVYDSSFDGESEVPADGISCDDGGAPNIVYLDTDPRTTGEMHEMFVAP